MNRRSPSRPFWVWALSATLAVAVGTGCSDAGGAGAGKDAGGAGAAKDAGGAGAAKDVNTGGAGENNDASSRDPVPPLVPGQARCGGVTCQAGTSGVMSSACCTDDDACGLRIVISTACLPKNEKGGVDSRCASLEVAGQLTLPGCCSPTGCGALANFDSLGCIPNPSLGRAAVPCTPDVPFE